MKTKTLILMLFGLFVFLESFGYYTYQHVMEITPNVLIYDNMLFYDNTVTYDNIEDMVNYAGRPVRGRCYNGWQEGIK